MGVFVIPRAQTLRFVRVDNYPSGDLRQNQSFDNRLLLDEKWQTPEYLQEYLQKFTPQDPILIQLTTNFNPSYITVGLYNEDDSLDVTGTFIRSIVYTYTDGSGNIVYNYLMDQSNLTFDGFKYIKITANDPNNVSLTYRSESFIFGNFGYLPYFTWQNSDRDGIYWDGITIFGIRAEIGQKYSATSESSMYEGFTFMPETLFKVPRRMNDLNSDPLPRYIAEKLELCFAHYNTYIDNIPFSSNGNSAKITKLDWVNLYTFSLQVLEVDYEDYTVLQPVTGVIIANSPYLDFDNSEFTDFDDTVFEGQQ